MERIHKSVILPVKPLRQPTGQNTCWLYSSMAYGSYYKEKEKNPQILFRRYRLNLNAGASIFTVQALLAAEYQIATKLHFGSLTFPGIKKSIDAGHPILARLRLGMFWEGHFVVIHGYGYDEDGNRIIFVADSMNGQSRIMETVLKNEKIYMDYRTVRGRRGTVTHWIEKF